MPTRLSSLWASEVWRIYFIALSCSVCAAQSTEGLISGQVTDSLTRQPLDRAQVFCRSEVTHTTRSTRTAADGRYTLALLPPDVYKILVTHPDHQDRQQEEIVLAVAGSLEIDFKLRPVRDLMEATTQRAVMIPDAATILNFYGPDVDPNHWTAFGSNPGVAGKLETGISDAVAPPDIRELPLAGENIYAVLLAEPGVTASGATSRSLGIAANGQRPSSSSFLLDGMDGNFHLTSGPVVNIAPEATQEYRISTNTFSAEYGGAAGYIANAVTRSGGDVWHGIGFFDLKNTILNANDFQANSLGQKRTPEHADRVGMFAGGPAWKKRLFSGTSIEYFRSGSQATPEEYRLPSAEFLKAIGCPGASNDGCRLLRNFPIFPATDKAKLAAVEELSKPVTVDQWLGLQRFDYRTDGQQASLRFASSNLSRPDFIWTPYRDYVSGLAQPVYNVAANWTWTPSSNITNQLAGGWDYDRVSWGRAHPEVPTLAVLGNIALLPGSPAAYGLDDSGRYFQFYDNATGVFGHHILKIGGGAFRRQTNDYLGYGADGEYIYCSLYSFGSLIPCPGSQIQFTTSLARGANPPTSPDLHRSYRSAQYYGFAQDTVRVTQRLVLNLGVRYDFFGAPEYDSAKRDWVVEFGTGSTFNQRLAKALLIPPSQATGTVYAADNRNFAPRLGFAYELLPAGHTLLRGGFGVFYDRLFDNLWLNESRNSFVLPQPIGLDEFAPVSTAIGGYANQKIVSSFPLTAFQPKLRNGYAEDLFLGVQTELPDGWSLELNGAGSLGRRLITTDLINRSQAVNPSLSEISYLGNQGLSDYYALHVVARWRGRHGFLQAAYTWSHAIDLQSDPLAGQYFDLSFASAAPAPTSAETRANTAAFSNVYDSRGSRASADFDQRQALVFYSYWQIPRGGPAWWRRMLSDLRFSQLAGIRSGFPYSIFDGERSGDVVDPRVRPIDPQHALLQPQVAVPGGVQLFVDTAFCYTEPCQNPRSGRNAFTGPGLINLDVSASRVLHPKWLGEGGGLTLRADCFNFLNHANLNPPANNASADGFGVALFGTPQQNSGFPALVPLSQSARQIQLMVRVSF